MTNAVDFIFGVFLISPYILTIIYYFVVLSWRETKEKVTYVVAIIFGLGLYSYLMRDTLAIAFDL